MKKILIYLVTLIFCFSIFSTDLLVVTEEWEDATNADGSGAYFDIIKAVFENEDYTIKYKIYPYKRALSFVEDKNADIVVGLYEGESELVIYPKIPFAADPVSVLMKKNQSAKYTGEKSLKSKKIGYMNGYGFDEYLKVPIKVNEVTSRESGIEMLNAGRIDYFLGNPYDIETALKNLSLSNNDYQMTLLLTIPMYICYINNSTGKKLVKIWDKNYPKLVKSGQVKSIFQKYALEDEYNYLLKSYKF
ncbi:MAG: transporter substrate-binding domain-containing protein [Spirochaetes bacterium]|nr:transporter substrate-binding domain-containing protein [Spirochaetota bacterium]